MFDRLELLIGKSGIDLIKSKHVLVVGLGGVGGECAISLVRSGISNISIVDFDIVNESNLNRQVVAFRSTIGKRKIDVIESLINDINPLCKVSNYCMFLDENNIGELFNNNSFDYVIDACDSRDTKKAIIKECLNRNIKFVSCMGTGNKLDPSLLEIVDIRKTSNDPLARVFRKWVKDEKINKKITVLCSKEVPIHTGNVVGSSSFVPNSAGLLIASYVFRDLLK